MDDEIQQIIADQINKLPAEIITFLSASSWKSDIDELSSLYNLSPEESSDFKREVLLVLTGLVHPDAFMDILKKEVGIKGAVLEALVLNVEKKIFVPIRPALITFFEEEAAKASSEKPEAEAPENLPTEDTTESFLPKLIPKTIEPVISPTSAAEVHPFEEKMKSAFTEIKPIETPQVEVEVPKPKPVFVPPSSDPYREPIE